MATRDPAPTPTRISEEVVRISIEEVQRISFEVYQHFFSLSCLENTVHIYNKKVEAEVRVVTPQPGCRQWISCDVCMERLETVTLAIQHKFKKHPNSNVKYFCGNRIVLFYKTF